MIKMRNFEGIARSMIIKEDALCVMMMMMMMTPMASKIPLFVFEKKNFFASYFIAWICCSKSNVSHTLTDILWEEKKIENQQQCASAVRCGRGVLMVFITKFRVEGSLPKCTRERENEQLKRKKKFNINLFEFTCFMLALGTWGLFFAHFLRLIPPFSCQIASHSLFLWASYFFLAGVLVRSKTPVLWSNRQAFHWHFVYRTHSLRRIVIVHTLLGIELRAGNVLIWSGGAHFFFIHPPNDFAFATCLPLDHAIVSIFFWLVLIFVFASLSCRNTIRFNKIKLSKCVK